ncbi:MAG: Gfo/Idh/MocA family oxidoreductase [Clostridia bacterium]|nr:Gfo/Idh/MocA family oxidoreductase [Clostridia bacterium]
MRTAIIGVGVIGNVHREVLLEQKKNVVALCDVNVEKTKAFSDIPVYTDYREMIEKERPDVVHICTPHYLHADMVVYALERDIHVLCEKPLCIKTEDIARILEAEEKSKAQLGVCFQNRYKYCNTYVKEYLAGKEVKGAIGFVPWKRDADYYHSAAWRGTWSQEGGGVLINQAIHTLDLLQWMLGMPDFITASWSNLVLKEAIEVEDTITLAASGNSRFTLFATNGLGVSFSTEIKIKTDKDVIRVCDNKVEINGENVYIEHNTKYHGKPCYGNGHGDLIADFYECIETGRKFPIDGKEAAKAVQLVLAAYASNGEAVKI